MQHNTITVEFQIYLRNFETEISTEVGYNKNTYSQLLIFELRNECADIESTDIVPKLSSPVYYGITSSCLEFILSL